MRLSPKIQGQKPASAENSFLFISQSFAEGLRDTESKGSEGRSEKLQGHRNNRLSAVRGVPGGGKATTSPGLWQAQLGPHECKGCFEGVRGEERGKVMTSCTGCDQNVRKSKKYVPREGHRAFWHNESNRHLSKAA